MITEDLAREAAELRAQERPFVQATVVRAARPTSARPGDTALVLGDGTIRGFVGGTCAQTSVRLHAARALERGEPVLLRLIPGAAPAAGAAAAEEGVVVAHNPCLSGGALDVFLDPQLPALRIVVAGDTPIARALETVGRAAGYDVVRGAVGEVEPRPGDAAVIVASHGDDEEIPLLKAIEAGVRYVGLVASPVRGASVRDALDLPDARRSWVHTPAGLDIGARAPAEVAIAILAELVAERVSAPADAVAPPEPQPGLVTAVAIDPMCGMEVVASDASLHVDADGGRVYFCREGCRAAYLAREAADAGAR
jgi:xanthine dehydrogenase accessory factor